jgi:hypothetical protein
MFKLCKLTIMNPVGKKKKKQVSNANKQKMCELVKKERKNLIKKNLFDKIHKLIIT